MWCRYCRSWAVMVVVQLDWCWCWCWCRTRSVLLPKTHRHHRCSERSVGSTRAAGVCGVASFFFFLYFFFVLDSADLVAFWGVCLFSVFYGWSLGDVGGSFIFEGWALVLGMRRGRGGVQGERYG